MKVHWRTYNHCLFVSYLASVAFGYGWISDTKFLKFSDKDWIWICKYFFGCGSRVEKSISAHLCSLFVRWSYKDEIFASEVNSSEKVKCLVSIEPCFLYDIKVSENDVLEVR